MPLNFLEIKSEMTSSNYEHEFVKLSEGVLKEDKYFYPDEPNISYEGYRKWAEPVACLSKAIKQSGHVNHDIEIMSHLFKRASWTSFSIKDMNDFLKCFITCHYWQFTEDKSLTDETKNLLKLKDVIVNHIKSFKNHASVCFEGMNIADYQAITFFNPNMELKSFKSRLNEYGEQQSENPDINTYPRMANMLIETDFELIKDDLNEENIIQYVDFLLNFKKSLNYKPNDKTPHIPNFMPFIILKDEYADKYGNLFCKNKELLSKTLDQWIQLSVEINSSTDIRNHGLFFDGTIKWTKDEKNYAYKNLVKLCEENKDYDNLGKLLLLKTIRLIPLDTNEHTVSLKTLNEIPWKNSVAQLNDLLKDSKVSEAYDAYTFESMVNSQIFPILLKETANDFQQEKENFKCISGVTLNFEGILRYAFWMSNYVLKISDKNQKLKNQQNLDTYKSTFIHVLNNKEKLNALKNMADFYNNTEIDAKEGAGKLGLCSREFLQNFFMDVLTSIKDEKTMIDVNNFLIKYKDTEMMTLLTDENLAKIKLLSVFQAEIKNNGVDKKKKSRILNY